MTAPQEGLAAAYARHRGRLEHALDPYSHLDRVKAALHQVLPAVFAGLGPPDGPAATQMRAVEDLVRAAVNGSLGSLRMPPRREPQPDRSDARGGIIPSLFSRLGSPPLAPPPAPPQPGLMVHVPTLLDKLQAVFEAADRLLAAAVPPPPVEVIKPWADDRELIALFHALLTAGVDGDGRLALDHVTQLRSDLVQRHGIRTVSFDGTNEELFAFTTQPVAGPATISPALVTDDGRVLKRGEARRPEEALGPSDTTVEPPEPAVAAPVAEESKTEESKTEESVTEEGRDG